jgi:hypothetical protein
MMKTDNTAKKQSGFFDLGLSLLILTFSGAAAYSIESAQPGKVEAANVETAAIGKKDPAAANPVAMLNPG